MYVQVVLVMLDQESGVHNPRSPAHPPTKKKILYETLVCISSNNCDVNSRLNIKSILEFFVCDVSKYGQKLWQLVMYNEVLANKTPSQSRASALFINVTLSAT